MTRGSSRDHRPDLNQVMLDLVSAPYREENLQKLADIGATWITRVPATLTEAQHALEQAPPEAM